LLLSSIAAAAAVSSSSDSESESEDLGGGGKGTMMALSSPGALRRGKEESVLVVAMTR